jgi:GTP-binding protein
VVLNKIDVPEARELADFVRPDLEYTGYRVFEVSTATHEGLDALRYALAEVVRQDREDRPTPVGERIILRPAPVNESQFTVEPDPEEPGGFVVRGTRPERWVRQTDFTNDEAVGFLADRLARLGVEDAMVRIGATPGASVTIGDVSFDWEPTTPAGLDVVPTGRGTDQRLDRPDRIGAAERKALHRLRRGLDIEGHQMERVFVDSYSDEFDDGDAEIDGDAGRGGDAEIHGAGLEDDNEDRTR